MAASSPSRYFSPSPIQSHLNELLSNHARSKPFALRVNCLSSQANGTEPKSQNGRMFILGMGFVGQAFARQLKNQGWVVCGTCTSREKKEELQAKGFHVCVFDANEPEVSVLTAMKDYTHLLVSLPPIAGVGDLMLQHGQLMRSYLADGNLQWLCYLSSTGVYGDCGGAIVNEDYPANPSTPSAKLRLKAEEGWLNGGHFLKDSARVFRLGGIYGHGRSAVDTLISTKPLSEGQKRRLLKQYTSRVHIDDVCQTLWASINVPSSSKIFNVVDDDPAPREEVFKYAAELIEKKWPGRFTERTSLVKLAPVVEIASPRSEKRVSNAHMKRELGVTLIHPSYRSGLCSIIEQMNIDDSGILGS